MNVIVLDTSFIAHGSIPPQRSDPASDAMEQLKNGSDTAIVPHHVVVEFGSLLRKLVNQRSLVMNDAAILFHHAISLGPVVTPTDEVLVRGFELATQLGQSDTFDATGYALAEALDGEFWTCDRRFANAGEAAKLPSMRLFA